MLNTSNLKYKHVVYLALKGNLDPVTSILNSLIRVILMQLDASNVYLKCFIIVEHYNNYFYKYKSSVLDVWKWEKFGGLSLNNLYLYLFAIS